MAALDMDFDFTPSVTLSAQTSRSEDAPRRASGHFEPINTKELKLFEVVYLIEPKTSQQVTDEQITLQNQNQSQIAPDSVAGSRILWSYPTKDDLHKLIEDEGGGKEATATVEQLFNEKVLNDFCYPDSD